MAAGAALYPCTLEQYLAIEEDDGAHFELDEGVLVMSPSTTLNHNEVRDRLNALLRAALTRANLGIVTSETDFLLGPATVRRPDVGIILTEHFREEYSDTVPIPIPPDIAIEVVSTHDRAAELLRKTQQYLRAGTRVVWLIYPRQRQAHRWVAEAAAPDIRAIEHDWDEPQLLPGVSVALTEFLTTAG